MRFEGRHFKIWTQASYSLTGTGFELINHSQSFPTTKTCCIGITIFVFTFRPFISQQTKNNQLVIHKTHRTCNIRYNRRHLIRYLHILHIFITLCSDIWYMYTYTRVLAVKCLFKRSDLSETTLTLRRIQKWTKI